VLSKHHTQLNNHENYCNELSDLSSIKNNTFLYKKKYSNPHINDKSLDNYIRNPISNDSALNINLFGNDLSESNQKINLTNINSLCDLEKLNNFKNIDSGTKNSSKYLETEYSNYNNPQNFTSKINKNLKINNFNGYNFNNDNPYKRVDLNSQNYKFGRKSLLIQGRNRQDIHNKFILSNLDTDTEMNYSSSENGHPKISKFSKFSKMKNFYSKNNFCKMDDINSNFINQTETNSMMYCYNNELRKPSHSPILIPLTNQNINTKKINYNYNLNNSINTPTKLFHIPGFKMSNNIDKDINKTSQNENFSNKFNLNNADMKKQNITNLNFSNSIRKRILQNSIKNSDMPIYKSKDLNDYKKIINPKIRIVSRNIEGKGSYKSQTFNEQKDIQEMDNNFINRTIPLPQEEKEKKLFDIYKDQNTNLYNEVRGDNENYLSNVISIEKENNVVSNFIDKRPSFNNNDDKNKYINSDENLNCGLENESNKMIKESRKDASTIKENYKNDSRNENQDTMYINTNENFNACCNCKTLPKNLSQKEKNESEESKKENNHANNRNEDDKEMTFNMGNNYKKIFNDIVSAASKEALLDEIDTNLAFMNKSSKNSSQKDFIISDSNDVEEFEISGKLITMDYSTLKKKSSPQNSLKEKNDKNKGSNYYLRNNVINQISNNIESKLSILDISGLKNSNSNPKVIRKDSDKDIMKNNMSNKMPTEDKIKIENLLKNLNKKDDLSKQITESRNDSLKNLKVKENIFESEKEIKEKNDENKNTNNGIVNFGVFRGVNIFLKYIKYLD
jgi:hypothetical protein